MRVLLKKLEGSQGEDIHRLYNLRRLFRSEIYCLSVTIFGLYALSATMMHSHNRHWSQSLTNQWHPIYEYWFELASSHWFLSIFEDLAVGSEVYKSIQSTPNLGLQIFFTCGLFLHHVFAIFVYNWCLFTHHLSGLAIFGFLFEIPVLLLNYREVSLNYEDLFPSNSQIFTSHTSLTLFWIILHFLWHVTRSTACLIYLLSLILWRDKIHSTLPVSSLIVYHLLGIGFNFINLTLLCTVLLFYICGDYKRMMNPAPFSHHPLPRVINTTSTATATTMGREIEI